MEIEPDWGQLCRSRHFPANHVFTSNGGWKHFDRYFAKVSYCKKSEKLYAAELDFSDAGLLVGCGKKVKFRGIFRDKFAEKTADYVGIFEASFA